MVGKQSFKIKAFGSNDNWVHPRHCQHKYDVCMHYLRTELCQTFDPGLEDVVYLHSEKGGKTECRADDKQLLTVASKIEMRQSMSYMMRNHCDGAYKL